MPRVHPTAFVDQSAQVIGDVEIGEASSVWMNVVMRGDVHWIRLGRRSNVQDGTVVHVMKGAHPTTIGDDVTIGHGGHRPRLHPARPRARRNGRDPAQWRGGRGGFDRRGGHAPDGRDGRAAAVARDGQPRQGAADADDDEVATILDVRAPLRRIPPRLQSVHVMASQQTRPARGMRDFLPDDVRRRDYVIAVVEDVYRRYGFEPLETPALENIETLTNKYGEEGNKLIFKVLRRGEHESSGEADLALRYDLTVPLARVVAEYRGKLPKFFKRYQIQPVWRADRPARGRFREFYQCDVDVVGTTSPIVEAELCAAVSRRARWAWVSRTSPDQAEPSRPADRAARTRPALCCPTRDRAESPSISSTKSATTGCFVIWWNGASTRARRAADLDVTVHARQASDGQQSEHAGDTLRGTSGGRSAGGSNVLHASCDCPAPGHRPPPHASRA